MQLPCCPGINSHWFVVAFALLISWATIRLQYQQIADVLKWLVLVLFAYPITAFVVGANWGQVLRDTLIPSMPHTRNGWATVVAILGTTISPYLFFWQASEEVEEEKSAGQSTLAQRRGATSEELELRNIDVGVGAFFSNMVMFFIILTTAITLNRHGITNIETSRQAAEALRPFAGNFATTVFTLGIVGVGFLAIPTLAGSAAYAFAETLGWRQGLNKKLRQARWFYALILVSTAVGVVLDFIGINPVKALYWTAVINGLLAPFLHGRNPDRGSEQEADAGPAELPPGMDCCGNHDNRHVRSGHCDVCCLSRRTKRPRDVLPARAAALCSASLSAASILRRPLTFQIPKQVPATSRPANTQSSGVDHLWSVPDHRRMAWRP